MSLRDGAETIVDQCLNVGEDEHVVIVNDGNHQDLVDALLDMVVERTGSVGYVRYREPEIQGEEPPENVAEAMKASDVFIAPTKKSISHTRARIKACEAGARGATLPGITRQVWNDALQADYNEVKRISEKVLQMLSETSQVRIQTPSGTDLKTEINIDYFHTDTGLIHSPGDFGNLPAGEADGGASDTEGTLVIDHMPIEEGVEGAVIEIEDNTVISVDGSVRLETVFSNVEGARNIAEFGFGTNPEATLIGNLLQDEKALGTVHVAFGDNTSYIPEGDPRRNPCQLHWDTISVDPTVRFDDRKVLDAGEPTFL
jgi:leucyl aminopeptidase (aminopeptidase T)